MSKTLDRVPGMKIDVYQDTNLFKFSLDAILLAHWLPAINSQQTLVDLGSGSGVVGLSLANKYRCQTTLIEIQSKLAQLSQQSIKKNNLSDLVKVLNIDMQCIFDYLQREHTNVVTCNPPYFSDHDGLKLSIVNSNNIAKHEVYFNPELLAKTMSGLLKERSCFYLVYRPDRLLELAGILSKYRLQIKELKFIRAHQSEAANLVLIKGIKTPKINGLKVWKDLTVYQNNGEYTEELKDFINE